MKELRELVVLTAILGQDAFWLMDKVGERTLDRLRARWNSLADAQGWAPRLLEHELN